MEPLRWNERPPGPPAERLREQEPSAQDAEPFAFQAFPCGPVMARELLQLPSAHDTLPVELTLFPFGPLRVASRLQLPPLQLPEALVVAEPLAPEMVLLRSHATAFTVEKVRVAAIAVIAITFRMNYILVLIGEWPVSPRRRGDNFCPARRALSTP